MDLEQAILDAWRIVRPRLDDDPHDLARRLARRRRGVLTRPPRAWCLALRASDTRLPRSPLTAHPSPLCLTPDDLRRLCAPVTLAPPGETAHEIAAKLGTTPMGLRAARINNVFRVRHVAGLGGRWGRPVPLLYTDRPLDPAARNFAAADPAWTWTARHLVARLPDSFRAVSLTRVACFRPRVAHRRYEAHVHPEAFDEDALTVLKRRKRLPEPEPDFVWYKWSRGVPGSGGVGSHYLGDDPSNWRKSPQDPGDRPPRYVIKGKSRRKPKPSHASGSLAFNGWKWLCPACGRTCRTIYLPLPPLNLLAAEQPRLAQIVDIPRNAVCKDFACERCHRVKQFSRVAHDAWNDLVTYLSAGLLYGHEVPRPAEFTKGACAAARKRAYKPRANARPSLRRPQVAELLLAGLTYAQIAERLGLKKVTIASYAQRLYAAHGVHGRAALARKLGRPDPRPTTRSQVQRLLAAGLTSSQIAEQLDITRKAVNDHAYAIRRQQGLPPRRYERRGLLNSFRKSR